jgi:hypothetical protein
MVNGCTTRGEYLVEKSRRAQPVTVKLEAENCLIFAAHHHETIFSIMVYCVQCIDKNNICTTCKKRREIGMMQKYFMTYSVISERADSFV